MRADQPPHHDDNRDADSDRSAEQLPTRRQMLKRSGTGLLATAILAHRFPQTLLADDRPEAFRDARSKPLKDLDGYFPMTVPKTLADWERRAKEVRHRILVACNLWPMPTKPELTPTIHGTVRRDGYTIDRVYFESHPGLFVTGSLYRPTGMPSGTKRPGILCPHGHWQRGRFYRHADSTMQRELKTEAEQFDPGGRSPMHARSAHLAKMGCVVFLYDMLGYADSTPVSYELAHRFAKQEEVQQAVGEFGLFSAQSELNLLSAFGLQTWNSIRCVDFLLTLPEVDATRIGVTGASGGGTQTMILSAVDDRIAAAFPAVMVSTAMQGGCTCENASHLRVGTGNIEFAALTAPRPLGVSAANDWTEEFETKGLPELQSLYKMYDASEKIAGKHFDFGHNFNMVSRRMMYDFFHTHFDLPGETPPPETNDGPPTIAEATVWTREHPKPPITADAMQQMLQHWVTAWDEQAESLIPTDQKSLERFREVYGTGWNVLLGSDVASRSSDIFFSPGGSQLGESITRTTYVLTDRGVGERTKINTYLRRGKQPESYVLWLSDRSRDAAITKAGAIRPEIKTLIDQGHGVVTVDLFRQNADGWQTPTRSVKNPREYLGFTLGYNLSEFAIRLRDVSRMVVTFQSNSDGRRLQLVGEGTAAALATAASYIEPNVFTRSAILPSGFRFANITDIRDPNLVPGAVKYGDLFGPAALTAPQPLWIGDPKPLPKFLTACYEVEGKPQNLVHDPQGDVAGMVNWLKAIG